MLKKFVDGLVFGAGFAISFVALLVLAGLLLFPMMVSRQIEHFPDIRPSSVAAHAQPSIPFHDLGLEDQIKESSVIALARFEPAPDGKMKAVIKEFLKKEPNATIYYNIGDEYPSSSYYPKDDMSHGDGLVIFFVGSPASMRMSMSYSGDRIHGLGDLPVELFRQKCAAPAAKQ